MANFNMPCYWAGWTLLEVITLIAADPPEQLRWLHDNQLAADELAQQVDDVVRSKLWDCCIDDDHPVVAEIGHLNDYLWSFSGYENAQRRTEAALTADPGWAEARRLARDFLPRLVLLLLANAPMDSKAV